MDYSLAIAGWFRHYGGGTLELPDGWYGRPMDALHQLTSLSMAGECLQLVLDETITLTFEGLQGVHFIGDKLTLGPASKIRFVRVAAGGSTAAFRKEYTDGVVTIHGSESLPVEAYRPSN